MEQHPIPQNVTTFQFRLIGDMTIKQFGYLAGGAILAYISYKLPLPFIITWPLSILFFLLGIGLAFVPIEERPMDVWILSFIKSIYSPTQYIWQKTKSKQDASSADTITTSKLTPDLPKEITALMDTIFNQPINAFLNKTLPRPAETKTAQNTALPVQKPVTPVRQENTEASELTRTESASPDVSQTMPISESFHPALQPANISTAPPAAIGTPVVKPPPIYGEKVLTPKTNSLKDMLRIILKIFTKPAPQKKPMEPFTDTQSMTGTRIDLQPESPKESKQIKREEVTMPKSQLHDLQPKPLQAAPKPAQVPEPAPTDHLPPVDIHKERAEAAARKEAQRAMLEKELEELHKRASKQQEVFTADTKALKQTASDNTPTVRIVTPESASRIGLPKLTTFANVVTGIIKDSEGNLLPGVLVTIRDKAGMPLRALKSNKLGQIAASTPLPNGTYTVEVEDPRGRFVFDRAQITLSGAVMPPIEILAKSQREVMRSQLEKEIFGRQVS